MHARSYAPRPARDTHPSWRGLYPLEARVLFSSSVYALETLSNPADDLFSQVHVPSWVDDDYHNTSQDQDARRELVFIDSAAEGYRQLLEDLRSQEGSSARFEVVVLSADRDGVEQITETLSTYSGLDAVHFISHGTDGALQLGDTWLNSSNVGDYVGELSLWGAALAPDADLLFYGCDLASGRDGRALLERFSTLSGADVAASTDLTGHRSLGGDWDLEYESGVIESSIAFSQALQSTWLGTLAIAIDTTSSGTVLTGTNSTTVSHTTAGSDRLILVGISFGEDKGDTVSTVTYNGVSLTLVGARDHTDPSKSRVEIWSLVAPDTGTHDVVVTLDGTNQQGATVGVMTFTGVDQVTPLGAFTSDEGSSNTPSTTVTSDPRDIVFGVAALSDSNDWDFTPGAGQTEQWDLHEDQGNGTGSTEVGAASTVTSWTVGTSSIWVAAGVSVLHLNIPQVLATNTGDTVDEGSTGNVITTAMLETTDVDSWTTELTYTVTGVTGNGTLRLSGVALGLNDTFTQDDINNNRITYDHDGSETLSDSFDFDVDDGVAAPDSGTFNFTVTGINDEQVLATNTGDTVDEGSTGNIVTTAMLQTTDPDHTAAQVVYTLTAVTGNGTLRLSGGALGLSSTFTQDDIDNNRITYDHDGSETLSDSFDFSVDDGVGVASTGTFNLTVTAVNDEQVLATNTGDTVDEGSTGNIITTAMLETTDNDHTAAQVVYTLTGVTGNGTLRLSGGALGLSSTFTQDDIDNNRITYDHDGSETLSDSFDFSVDDGVGVASTGTFNLTVTAVNDEQVLATNTGDTVNEGSTGNIITTAMLETTDPDHTAVQVVYTLTGVTGNGTLRLSGGALGLSSTFTQDDIDNNRITYDHDGSETLSDSFDFSVDDGVGTASTGTFNLTVTAVNDEQVLTTNTGDTVNEGSTGNIITTAMLQTTDNDHTAVQVVYTLTGVAGNGTLRLSGGVLGLSSTFTQDDIDNNRITYHHDGSETLSDSFNFSVDDGVGTASTGTFNLSVNPVNDAPTFTANRLVISEGQSVTIESTDIHATDAESGPGLLVYTVSGLTGGQFELVGSPGVAVLSFTQAQVDASQVIFVHNGSNSAPAYSLQVSDGSLSDGPMAAHVIFNIEASIPKRDGDVAPPLVTGMPTGLPLFEPPAESPGTGTEPGEATPPDVTTIESDTAPSTGQAAASSEPAPATESAPESEAAAAEPAGGTTVTAEATTSVDATPPMKPAGGHAVASATKAAPAQRGTRTVDQWEMRVLKPVRDQGLTQAMSDVQEQFGAIEETHRRSARLVVGQAVVVSSLLTTGYFVWLFRGASILAGVLTSMPAWKMIDPLAVLPAAKPHKHRWWWRKRDKQVVREKFESVFGE